MAFAATTNWDVRTTGSDSNGGGFDTASSGTDHSQSNGPFNVFTDMVIGATTTTFTSALTPVTAGMVGNIINVTSGTGFTVQRVQIVSQAGGVATCDKSLGTASSTGGHGNLGGSLATIPTVVALMTVAGMIGWVQAGTYTITTGFTFDPSTVGGLELAGYQTAHGDNGTKPLITTATNSTILCPSLQGLGNSFVNLAFSNTATTRADGFRGAGTFNFIGTFIACTFDGFVVALNGDNGGATGASGWVLSNCEIKNCTSDGIRAWFPTYLTGCYIHNNAGYGWKAATATAFLIADFSVLAANTSGGSYGGTLAYNSVFSSNTGPGITMATPLPLNLLNCIVYGNGTFGISSAYTPNNTTTPLIINTAFGSNASGNFSASVSLYWQIIGQLNLTASPFAGAGNFALNSTAGGGALLSKAGFPGVFPGGTGYVDVGAVQTTGGVAAASVTGYAFS